MAELRMTLNDRLWTLERDLAKAAKDGSGWALTWRLLLREALTEADQNGYRRGHLDGSKDVREAAHLERDEAAGQEPDHDCPLECCRAAVAAVSEPG